MYGSHETSLRETDEINGVRDVLVNVSDKYQQAITSLSTTVGLGLNAKDYEFRIGYEFNVWYNLADRLVFLATGYLRWTHGNLPPRRLHFP